MRINGNNHYQSYEKQAQRGIQLLMQRLEVDFGTSIVCGAELEFDFSPKKGKRPYLASYISTKRTTYETFAARTFLGTVHGEIEDNHYLANLYDDGGRTEAVFTHGSYSNPLRLAGAVETFKSNLATGRYFTPESTTRLSFSPIARGLTQGLEFNISLKRNDEIKCPTFNYGTLRLYMLPVFYEILHFGFSTPESVQRFERKYVNVDSMVKIKDYFKGNHCLECDYLSPNSNAYLGMLGVLAAIYHGLYCLRKGIKPNEDKLEKLNTLFEGTALYSTEEFLEIFRQNLEKSTYFRRVLNNLSGPEKLGDKIIDAILKTHTLSTPADNRVITFNPR